MNSKRWQLGILLEHVHTEAHTVLQFRICCQAEWLQNIVNNIDENMDQENSNRVILGSDRASPGEVSLPSRLA